MADPVKNPPAMWETWARSLGWEDPMEIGKSTHSRILCGSKEVDTTEQLSLSNIFYNSDTLLLESEKRCDFYGASIEVGGLKSIGL